jgi:hypothetical protein
LRSRPARSRGRLNARTITIQYPRVSRRLRARSACRRSRASRRSDRHRGCDSFAGARHRRQHRDLLSRQQPAAPHAAGL